MVEDTTVPGADARTRGQALDVTRSFIVQAPAGSGKTELLTQRFLSLLATVECPEEVVAITFTRKAQGEMLSRITGALEIAASEAAPEESHKRATWEAARAVLARDRRLEWRILEHPARLRVMTIDALNSSLARRMPYLSRSGAGLTIAQDANALYARAARRTLESLGRDIPGAPALQRLVVHLDNRLEQIERLLCSMLGQRDRWLRLVVGRETLNDRRAALETAMRTMAEDTLGRAATLIPEALASEIVALAVFAANNGPDSRIAYCVALEGLPLSTREGLEAWWGVADLLLTDRGSWRKQVNRRQGFPGGSSSMKSRYATLLHALASHEDLRIALEKIKKLPHPQYTEPQWEALDALLEVLPLAAAQLELIFMEEGRVDYIAVAGRALQALGEPNDPTDLALYLDYSIRHILVDEFQDTSYSQHELLQRLTAGWEEGDARTFFCVGDPMQSIYRFREADVGLFMQSRRSGIGDIALVPLRLSMNFRSQKGIVDWVNASFATLFPAIEDISTGAVPYASFDSHHGELPGDPVTCKAYLEDDPLREARDVIALVKEARREQPAANIAILVSARTHLIEILPQLRRTGLRFQAIEIEQLLERPAIQDLVALTSALSHLADRPAWLAVLRAPWCGLSLKDLHAVSQGAASILKSCHDPGLRAQLSADGRGRLDMVLPVLDRALKERRRSSLRRWIEGAWLALGGPATVEFTSDLEDALSYLELLEGLDRGADLLEPLDLAERLEELHAAPDTEADSSLQVMTIHKAKGLQFDVVILPGLGRRPRHREKALLHWLELVKKSRRDNVILAPVNAAGEDEESWHHHLHLLEQERERYERGRLLYVAATRARERLHLLGHTTLDDSVRPAVPRDPAKGSFLALLWPRVREVFERAAGESVGGAARAAGRGETPAGIRRFPTSWRIPSPPPSLHVAGPETSVASAEASIEFDWAGEVARQVGIVVHSELQRIAEEGLAAWSADRVEHSRARYELLLEERGLPQDELAGAQHRVRDALTKTLADPHGQWILGPRSEAESELALTGVHEGTLRSIVIDRTFVDEKGDRWVIDYKTSVHLGGGEQQFLDNEVRRYRTQLELYGVLMAKRNPGPLRLALYFPLLQAFREIQP